MPAGVEKFVSAVKRSRIWSEDDVIDFLQTQSAFSGCGVVCGRPVQDLPPDLVGCLVCLKFRDVGTEPGLVFIISKICIVLSPPFLECISGKSSVVFYPVQ